MPPPSSSVRDGGWTTRSRTIIVVARTDDPFKGPWAGELGRLDKLLGQLAYVRELPTDIAEKWEGLLFTVGMLRDILNNVVLDIRERFPDGPV